jgi:hypothetical protein
VLPVAALAYLPDLAVGLRWLTPAAPALGVRPTLLARAILSAPFGLALFAGTALVAFAAARAPATSSQPGGNDPSVPLPRAPTPAHET